MFYINANFSIPRKSTDGILDYLVFQQSRAYKISSFFTSHLPYYQTYGDPSSSSRSRGEKGAYKP